MARPTEDNDPAAHDPHDPPPSCPFDDYVTEIAGYVAAQSCDEPPASASNVLQSRYVATDPPHPESTSGSDVPAQRLDQPATAATEAEAAEDSDGAGKNQNAPRRASKTGSSLMSTTSHGV